MGIGDPAPPPPENGAQLLPQFLAHVYCGQTAGFIKMPLGTMEVGIGPGHIVLDGDPAPFPLKRGRAPQFSAHVFCGQTAGWIKIPLGTEVGLGPDRIVLDGNLAPLPKKGHSQAPAFRPCLFWPNGWMDQDATWYKGRPEPRPHCVTWGSSSPQKGHSPQFFGSCLLWPNGRPSRLLLSTCYSFTRSLH